MWIKNVTVVLALSIVMLSGCNNFSVDFFDEVETTSVEEETETMSEYEKLNKKIVDVMDNMTLEEEIYQMFIVTPEALTGYKVVTAAGDVTKEKLKETMVGGIVYFSQNLVNVSQTMEMLENTQTYAKEISGIPIFLCVDEEGGRVARIANNPEFKVPKVGSMKDIESDEEAYRAGETIGQYLSKLGFNLNFAPVADVITNDKNTVIGERSFGTDPYKVGRYAFFYTGGLHANGVLSTYKHFPGHGSTEGDTHDGFAYTNRTYEEMISTDLLPFADAKKAFSDAVMVSHIAVPKITGSDIPSSLSYEMVTNILKNQFKYDGLVITDAMNMGAITEHYTCEEATVLAVCAGADMILMPEDLDAAVNAIIKAVESGRITEMRINESVYKILESKLKMEQ